MTAARPGSSARRAGGPPSVAHRTPSGRCRRRPATPSVVSHRLALAALVGTATLLVAGCSGDAVTSPSPEVVACTDEPGCRPTQSAPVDGVVFAAVTDARERLVPMVDDAAARATLAQGLQRMAQALEANRGADARARLGEVYAALDRLHVTSGGATFDLPDAAAIRLALVPVANALGVQAR